MRTPQSYQTCLLQVPRESLFTGGFLLRCFQKLSTSSVAALPALSDNRYTRGSEPSFLSYWKILPLRHLTPPPDIEQTVSRRSEPSSRNSLMGEHPHPWTLLHVQVELSRHRRSKQRRQFELLGATTQLSPG